MTPRKTNRELNAAAQREQSAKVRDIGPVPAVANKRRRNKCRNDRVLFLATYFPGIFHLPWSVDQLRLIEAIKASIENEVSHAVALPRGSGKTSISVCMALHDTLYGIKNFCLLIAATELLSGRLLDAVRVQLQSNDRLAADFPEVCYPIRKLENITNRQAGQTCGGSPTYLRISANEIVFPTVAGSKVSGTVIRTAALTGAIRGQIIATTSGETRRPDLVLCDDPQTRESGRSPMQTQEREDLIKGDILGLAGPGSAISVIMPCTVIYPGDLSDRFLDHAKNPTWRGHRGKMIYELPKNIELWDQYAELRRQSFVEHGDNRLADAMYLENRSEMDAGHRLGWPARKNPKDISALQFVMNLKIDTPKAFDAEYQNEPQQLDPKAVDSIKPDSVASKLNHILRSTVPRESSRLTAFVDVGKSVLWYAVCAWDDAFGGSVVDYGCWPRQTRSYFDSADPRPTIQDEFPGSSEEAQIHAALTTLTSGLLGTEYLLHETLYPVRIDRLLVDAGYWTQMICKFIRQSPFAPLMYPSKGYVACAGGRDVDEWKPKPGERKGPGWRLSLPQSGQGRLLTFDPNYWKTFVLHRLCTPFGAHGCLSVFGSSPHTHQMFADHCTSEYYDEIEVRGGVKSRWVCRPGRRDNHWWDCLVGCAVAASEQGCQWSVSSRLRPTTADNENRAGSVPQAPPRHPPRRGGADRRFEGRFIE